MQTVVAFQQLVHNYLLVTVFFVHVIIKILFFFVTFKGASHVMLSALHDDSKHLNICMYVEVSQPI